MGVDGEAGGEAAFELDGDGVIDGVADRGTVVEQGAGEGGGEAGAGGAVLREGLQEMETRDLARGEHAGAEAAEEGVIDRGFEPRLALGEIAGVDLVQLHGGNGKMDAAGAEVGDVDDAGAADLAGEGEVPLLDVAGLLIAEDGAGAGEAAEQVRAVFDAVGGFRRAEAGGEGIRKGVAGGVVGVEDVGGEGVVEGGGDDAGFGGDGEEEDAVAGAGDDFVGQPEGEADAGLEVAVVGLADGAGAAVAGEVHGAFVAAREVEAGGERSRLLLAVGSK